MKNSYIWPTGTGLPVSTTGVIFRKLLIGSLPWRFGIGMNVPVSLAPGKGKERLPVVALNCLPVIFENDEPLAK